MDRFGNLVRHCCETCYYYLYDAIRDQYRPYFCGCEDSDHPWSNVSWDDVCECWCDKSDKDPIELYPRDYWEDSMS